MAGRYWQDAQKISFKRHTVSGFRHVRLLYEAAPSHELVLEISNSGEYFQAMYNVVMFISRLE